MRLLDCGADIGIFSVKAVSEGINLDEIIAFEPNKEAYELLKRNLGRLPLRTEAKNMAVSDFVGSCTLQSPVYDASDSAQYIVRVCHGDIPVTTIDDLRLGSVPSLVLKIDVEGAELSVMQGALSTLSDAKAFIVVFEAHRSVAARTGIDPIECVKYLKDIKDCHVRIAEAPNIMVTTERKLFDQVGDIVVANVICTSKSRADCL